MNQQNTPIRETLKQADYSYVSYEGNKQHVLRNTQTGELELWFSNKNHASYGLVYKNTHLEFARTISKVG